MVCGTYDCGTKSTLPLGTSTAQIASTVTGQENSFRLPEASVLDCAIIAFDLGRRIEVLGGFSSLRDAGSN